MTEATVGLQLQSLATEHLSGVTLTEGPLDAQLDSLQRLTLVVAVEDHFEICFEPEDDEEAATAADVVRIVLRHLEAKLG